MRYRLRILGRARGHFTQLVWHNTTEVGCGQDISKCGNEGSIYVLRIYDPAGNWIGKNGRKVKPPTHPRWKVRQYGVL